MEIQSEIGAKYRKVIKNHRFFLRGIIVNSLKSARIDKIVKNRRNDATSELNYYTKRK